MPRTQSRSVLLVEDDTQLAEVVSRFLKLHAVDAVTVGDRAGAWQLIESHHFDAIVVDLTLGVEDANGLVSDVAREQRTPIVIISGRGDEVDRILGLELGADDYLAKPFSHRELLARLRAIWRRLERDQRGRDPVARFGQWQADLGRHELVDSAGQRVILTAGESQLLRVFLRHPQQMLSRQDLLHYTGHAGDASFDRSVDVLIARLRRKLADDAGQPAILETVRGSGYRFLPFVSWDSGEDARL